ncbi:MAG: universal stress protein UspA [Firmicutes bacterium]|nr:universal stress protein UspA [Bacillota bacterium]
MIEKLSTLPKKTMVCVTVQKTCERLIREGASIAGDAGLNVVHVARSGAALLGAGNDGEALEYLYRIARQYGAEMDMLRADDVVETIVRFARKHGVECVVLGAPGVGSRDFAEVLRLRLPGVSVVVVP